MPTAGCPIFPLAVRFKKVLLYFIFAKKDEMLRYWKFFLLLPLLSWQVNTIFAQSASAYDIPCDELEDHPAFRESDSLPMEVPEEEVPATLSEALSKLDEVLNPYQQRYIACLPPDEIRETLHHGFGTWVRNVWSLWDASPLRFHFIKRGVLHPDDMSSIVLVSYYRKLTGAPLNVEQQIDYFYKYWKAKGVNIDSMLLSAQQNIELIEQQQDKAGQ